METDTCFSNNSALPYYPETLDQLISIEYYVNLITEEFTVFVVTALLELLEFVFACDNIPV